MSNRPAKQHSPEAARLLELAHQDYQRRRTLQAEGEIAVELSGRRAERRMKAADNWRGRASRA
ncbi:hypothetical protein [Streptomyces klenkii]|uniref:hypothetical protein n=1 Tax=Streptomyces klenkii TaxID=1420899 RepID=UPI00342B903C